MRYLAPAVVLGLSVACWAVEPATQPANAYPALQKRLVVLGDQVADLKRQLAAALSENAALKAQLAKALPADKHDPAERSLKEGMTLAQVKALLGDPASSTKRSDGANYVHWDQYEMRDPKFDPSEMHPAPYDTSLLALSKPPQVKVLIRTFDVVFKDGKVAFFEQHTINPDAG